MTDAAPLPAEDERLITMLNVGSAYPNRAAAARIGALAADNQRLAGELEAIKADQERLNSGEWHCLCCAMNARELTAALARAETAERERDSREHALRGCLSALERIREKHGVHSSAEVQARMELGMEALPQP